MFDCAFVDLDDTLYNTRQFKEDIFSVFKASGISRENFLIAYRKAAELGKFGYFDYSFEKQIEQVCAFGAVVPEDALEQLNSLLNKNYLLDGVDDFLMELRIISKKLVLLTAGNIKFQAKKIQAIGVASHFDEVLQIPGGKEKAVARFITPGGKILFINDNLGENIIIKNAFPEVDVLTILNLSYWTSQDCEQSGLPWFNNLSELTKYLANK